VKAVGYVRVSTDEQAKEGISLAAQSESIKSFCRAKDWDLMEIIRDEGLTAKDLRRAGIRKLIAMIKARTFDVVVIYRLDRLTRNIRDLGYLVQDVFERFGVDFSSIKDSFDTSTASGKLVLNVLGSIAQWEREMIAERTRDGLRYKKARLECYGPIPYGFVLKGNKLTPEPEEMATVDWIRDLRGRYEYSYRLIADILNANGNRARSGGDWHPSSIRNIANNEIYAQIKNMGA